MLVLLFSADGLTRRCTQSFANYPTAIYTAAAGAPVQHTYKYTIQNRTCDVLMCEPFECGWRFISHWHSLSKYYRGRVIVVVDGVVACAAWFGAGRMAGWLTGRHTPKTKYDFAINSFRPQEILENPLLPNEILLSLFRLSVIFCCCCCCYSFVYSTLGLEYVSYCLTSIAAATTKQPPPQIEGAEQHISSNKKVQQRKMHKKKLKKKTNERKQNQSKTNRRQHAIHKVFFLVPRRPFQAVSLPRPQLPTNRRFLVIMYAIIIKIHLQNLNICAVEQEKLCDNWCCWWYGAVCAVAAPNSVYAWYENFATANIQ